MKKTIFCCVLIFVFLLSAFAAFADTETDIETDIETIEVSVPSTNRDIEIPAYFVVPETETDKVVVLIHGHHGNHNEWGGYDKVADGLAENGILVAELDFAGCGNSAEDFTYNAMSYMCADVLDVINYARNTYGVNKIGVMGYSMGGRIVAQMLIEDMITFDSIVFVAPAVSLNDMIVMFGGQEHYDMMKETIKGTTDMYPFEGAYGIQLLSNEFFNDLEKYGEDMAEMAAAKYPGKSLTIYSTDDFIVNPMVSEQTALTFGSTIITVNNLGHSYNFYGEDPTTVAALNTAIVTFLTTDLNAAE